MMKDVDWSCRGLIWDNPTLPSGTDETTNMPSEGSRCMGGDLNPWQCEYKHDNYRLECNVWLLLYCVLFIVYLISCFVILWFRIKWSYATVWGIRHVSTTRMGSILANEQAILCFYLAYVCWGYLPVILFQLLPCCKLESSNSAGMICLVIGKVPETRLLHYEFSATFSLWHFLVPYMCLVMQVSPVYLVPLLKLLNQ